MTQQKFDADAWTKRLAEALEALAREVSILSRGGWISYDQYRALADRAKDDSDIVCLDSAEPIQAKAILREHPIVGPALTGSGKSEGIGIVYPHRFRINLNSLVTALVKHTIKADGRRAAAAWNRYLTDGEAAKLQAREFSLVYGLKLRRRVDIADGAFLTPFDEAFIAEYGFSEKEVEHFSPRGITKFFRDDSGGSSVLVRDLTWGPGVAPERPESPEFSPKIVHRLPHDLTVIMDLLTVAAQRPAATYMQHIRPAQWIRDIGPSFAFGSWGGWVFLNDGWWNEEGTFRGGGGSLSATGLRLERFPRRRQGTRCTQPCCRAYCGLVFQDWPDGGRG